MTAELGFGLFALLLVGLPALRVVTSPNLVRASSGSRSRCSAPRCSTRMLHAPFLAGVQVLTYVGGVVTLMIFGVMVTRKHDGTTVAIDATPAVRGRRRGAGASSGWSPLAILRTDLLVARPGRDAVAPQELAHVAPRPSTCSPSRCASVLLLAAIIGAVVLARRRDPGAGRRPSPPGPAALREGSAP